MHEEAGPKTKNSQKCGAAPQVVVLANKRAESIDLITYRFPQSPQNEEMTFNVGFPITIIIVIIATFQKSQWPTLTPVNVFATSPLPIRCVQKIARFKKVSARGQG